MKRYEKPADFLKIGGLFIICTKKEGAKWPLFWKMRIFAYTTRKNFTKNRTEMM